MNLRTHPWLQSPALGRPIRRVFRWARQVRGLVSPTGFRLRSLRNQLRSSPPPPMPDVATGRTGLAVITYNRLDFLQACVASLDSHDWGQAHIRMIVDDGSTQGGYPEYLDAWADRGITVIRHGSNQGVARTKNDALRGLMNAGCKHLFLMEDDILVKSEATLAHYIAWAERTGLQHLNFALHGERNSSRERIVKRDNQWLLCYPALVGAFSYFTRQAIDQVGYCDEQFHNAFEHIDHTYRIAQAGLTLPFWQFADHPLNVDLIGEQPLALANSAIRHGDWENNRARARQYWETKHGPWPPAKRRE